MCDVAHVDTVVRLISLPLDRFLCIQHVRKIVQHCAAILFTSLLRFSHKQHPLCASPSLLICCLLPTFLLTYHHIFTTCTIELMPFSSSSKLVSYSGSKHACNRILLLWNKYVKDCLRCTEMRKEFT